MEDIFKLLTESSIVQEFDVLSAMQDEDFYYLKIKSNIIDGSELHIKIYLSDTEYNYSFHWQKKSEELILRWDNAPHHSNIKTFPHHVHAGEGIDESYSITLKDVLRIIKKRIEQKENKKV